MNTRLLCFYGDDFTGSTDVLESLFTSGLKSILFLEPPTKEQLKGQFANVSCIGVAGVGRSLTPTEMEEELKPIFITMKEIDALIYHYKVCSTFDSSQSIGSIGKAIEIGRDVFQSGYVPLVVGVPYLRRYTVFGQHFAQFQDQVFRLDHHPTMSVHPSTPMKEGDLLVHLGKQTSLSSTSFNIIEQTGPIAEVEQRLEATIEKEDAHIVLFDVLDDARLQDLGKILLYEAQRQRGKFMVGSSGIEYALAPLLAELQTSSFTNYSKDTHEGNDHCVSTVASNRQFAAVEQLFVISGSCSPMTMKQIAKAQENGFVTKRIPLIDLINDTDDGVKLDLFVQEIAAHLSRGDSLVLYTALGPSDCTLKGVSDTLLRRGYQAEDTGRIIGNCLGRITRSVLDSHQLKRIVIAGGDSSGYITRALDIYAIECISILEAGVPLCKAYSKASAYDELELVLKGGQVGSESFFQVVKAGNEQMT